VRSLPHRARWDASRSGNLPGRIREQLYTPNKDRSIFRKHVGRCLLNRNKDPFLAQWEIDLTPTVSRNQDGDRFDRDRLQEVEAEVTRYMVDSFSFTTLRFGESWRFPSLIELQRRTNNIVF